MVADTENLQASPGAAEETVAPEPAKPEASEAEAVAGDLGAKPEDHANPFPEVSFDIPRPFLTLAQAARLLGKSLRALERSVLGKWGNKLPDGWRARKIPTEKGFEWRIIPPPGFRLRQVSAPDSDGRDGHLSEQEIPGPVATPSASEYAGDRRRPSWPAGLQSVDRPSIIIDRSEEVEYLLRELIQAQKQLSEERRLRLEDLRLITQMQGSLRLLETRASETTQLKGDLTVAQQELRLLRQNYTELLSLPWWKRLFRPKSP